MMASEFAVLFIVIGFGCGSGAEHSGGDAGSVHVTIRTGQPPAFVAVLDESTSQWQSVDVLNSNNFDVVTKGSYRVIIVCNTVNGETDIQEYARTLSDDPVIEGDCDQYPFLAYGQVKGAGAVFLGDHGAISVGSSWVFDLPAASGSFDLVMLSGNYFIAFDSIAIRRGLAIGADTDLGILDYTTEVMYPLKRMSFTPLNFESGERLFSDTLLYAGNTIAAVDESVLQFEPAWDVRLATDGVLGAMDHQVVSFSAIMSISRPVLQTRYRNVRQETRVDSAVSVTLPEPIGSVRFALSADRLVAAWESLPDHDEIALERISLSSDGSQVLFHQAVLSAAYVDSVGASSAALDLTNIPGFRNEWRHDPTSEQLLGLFAQRGASRYDSAFSGFLEEIPGRAGRQSTDASGRVTLWNTHEGTHDLAPSLARKGDTAQPMLGDAQASSIPSRLADHRARRRIARPTLP